VAAETVLRLTGITKRFGRLVANNAISLELDRGEILGLLGENGAGKSTLMAILFGHYVADEGRIEVFGKPLAPGSPRDALAAGIGMVHQHFVLADNLTALENIVIGTEHLWALRSKRPAARERLLELSARYGLSVDPDRRVGSLSVGEQQRVEILKAMYRGARILILDEPTAVLTPQESATLFATLRLMVDDGLSIILISHKLREVASVCGRIAVLRRGELVAQLPTAGADPEQLAELMVGRRVDSAHSTLERVPKAAVDRGGEPLVRLAGVEVTPEHGSKGLSVPSLEIFPGEIVAIAGVAGNGQDLLADLLCSQRGADAGRVELAGARYPATPRRAVTAGIGRVPEDRHRVGVVGALQVWENCVLETYTDPRFSSWGMRRRAPAIRHGEAIVAAFDVRTSGIEAVTGTLSGGNIQKLILGRVLTEKPRFIVVNQPTWGLDIGAVSYIHAQLLAARASGAAILLVSQDLEEIMALADRIGVMHAGHLGPVRPAGDWTVSSIGLAMAGAA
jgi:general nucleoside transport system ATP-binding protein